MNKKLKLGVGLLLSLGLLTGCQQPQPPKGDNVNVIEEVKKEPVDSKEYLTKENTTAVTDIGSRLLIETMKEEEGENTLISPVSIVYALAMTENGADGETLKEFEESFGVNREVLNNYLHAYLGGLPSSEDYKFNLANSIWINENAGFKASEDFLQVNKDYLNAEIYEAAFNKETVDNINEWVNKNTQEMIPSVIDEIQESEIMYLINALALDAKWDKEYSLESVSEDNFIKEDGTEINTEFMYEEGNKYLEGTDETGFVKDYKDGKYSFVALLPNEGISMEDYVETLKGEKIQNLFNDTQYLKVRTLLPKFETEFSTSLVDSLRRMGIEQAFSSEEADFSKMGEASDYVSISNVIHKTYINVDELGTQAGAVTAVIMELSALPADVPKEVFLTRPFVYMIIDNENQLPIFIGTLMDTQN